VSERHDLGPVGDYAAGEITIREVDGRSVGIFNGPDGFSAILNLCPHRAAPVCEGIVGGTMLPSAPGEFVPGLDGLVLRCPWHRWEYDLRTGESIGPVDKRNLTMYEVTVEDGRLWTELRRAQPAGSAASS
jgi:nitrite reductase (NADH) small subunit